ncbi:MAG: 2-oxo acid dehydrogenase subunit E2 [bacterium]
MTNEFKLPELGENITSAQVTKVLVKPGDKIIKDQSVLEIETDKASVEVPAELEGIIKEVFIKEGAIVKVGSIVFTFELENELPVTEKVTPIADKIAEPAKEPNKIVAAQKVVPVLVVETGKAEFKLPELGENITLATITKVLIKKGDIINADTIVLEIETDKATVEVPSEMTGTVTEVFVKSGEKAKVGQVIFTISGQSIPKASAKFGSIEKDEPVVTAFKPEVITRDESSVIKLTPPIIPPRSAMPIKIAPAAPSVRRFAREIGIDIHLVRGSDKSGRISVEDVKTFAKSLNERILSNPASSAFGVKLSPLPDFSKWGDIERVEMSNIRKKTAEHLSYAWSSIPAVTQFDKADITELEKIRKMFGKKVEAKGAKLTVTAILLKIIASALKVYPQFNATIDIEKNEIIYKKYYNIGIAVDTDRGLLVPVIKNVDKKNIVDLAVELGEISVKARNKKLTIEDMVGGNFSISNLGSIGGTFFTPIVNSPEVAILGVSRSFYEPVYVDGKFEPRLILPLSLSYDHRIIDGADGARFIRWIVEAMEQPFLLALEG